MGDDRADSYAAGDDDIARAVVAAAPNAIVTLDRDQAVMAWNPAAERLFGWAAGELLGRRAPVVPAELTAEHNAVLERVRTGGQVSLRTKRFRRDGSLLDVRVDTSALRSEAGVLLGYVSLRAMAPPAGGKSAERLIASERILASVCESVIGAAYLAFGMERVAPAVVEAFAEQVTDALEHPVDYKSILQERLARHAETVAYRIESEEGPPHDRRFVAAAVVGGEEIGRGEGKTKKSAEQEAALRALDGMEG